MLIDSPHKLEKLAAEQDFCVSRMANYFDMDTRSFRYFFEKRIGVPPKFWLKQARVRRGVQLLKEGQSPKKISTKLGYCSPSHMCNEVKELTGLSPLRLQKSCKLRNVV